MTTTGAPHFAATGKGSPPQSLATRHSARSEGQTRPRADAPTRVGFLMAPNYTMITLAAAIAVLRMANRQSGRELYRWQCVTLDGHPTPSSDGLRLVPDCAADALGAVDFLFVCGGYRPERHCVPPFLAALRRFAKRRANLGALCTGSHYLAAAGLLDGYRCAIHWENADSLRAQFPTVQVSSSLFVMDRDRYTCSGGVSSIDLMLNLVAGTHGRTLARDISEQFIVDRMRTGQDPQRAPLHQLMEARNQPKLMEAVTLMEANIDEPLAMTEVAALAGVSRRQLQRLFHRYLHCAPTRHYLDLRLERGRLLLLQTGFPLADVATRCGFSSVRLFSKRYLQRYGRHPRQERRDEA